MTGERDHSVEKLFYRALEIPESERDAFLEGVCGADETLRGEVETLLGYDRLAHEGFLSRPLYARSPVSPVSTTNPDHVGPYRILRRLGAGGMGIVYEAEQQNPRRRVALKVLRSEQATPIVLRRFRDESQVLGRLQHPGIAHVYEAGIVTQKDPAGEETEIPYFAMELIRGRHLNEYARASSLKTREILDLIARICDAVQYAHENGVVHRDLKPANIFVTERGEPKVVDFGIARVTDSDLKTTAMRTDVGQLLGTVTYMSPEQISGDPEEIDGRSDVYALGVLLYELVTGILPHEVSGLPLPEAVRRIAVDDPPRLTEVAPHLNAEVATIVHKALEKEKHLRYESAGALAADLRRYLCHEPILARPPSTMYQLKKFARRNKPLVGGVSVGFLAMMLGSLVAVSQAAKATRSANTANTLRWQAEERQKDVERKNVEIVHQKKLAEEASEESDATVEFLTSMLQSADPEELGRDVLVRDVLEHASEQVEAEWSGRPRVEARIRSAIGLSYRALGLAQEAEHHLHRAYDLRREVGGRELEDDETRLAFAAHARALFDLDQMDTAEAMFKRALVARRNLHENEGPNEEALLLQVELAEVYVVQERFSEAEQLFQETLRDALMIPDLDESVAYQSRMGLVWVLTKTARLPEAEVLLTDLIAERIRSHGEQDPTTLILKQRLAVVSVDQARYDVAEKLSSECIVASRSMYGEDHHKTLGFKNTLATVLGFQGKYRQAEEIYLEVLRVAPGILGEAHRSTLAARHNLAHVWMRQGKLREAKELVLPAIEALSERKGPDSVDLATTLNVVGSIHFNLGEHDDAQKYFGRALAIAERKLDPNDSFLGILRVNRGGCLANLDRFEEAEQLILTALRDFEKNFAPDHRNVLAALTALEHCYRHGGKIEEADVVVRRLKQEPSQ